LSLQQQLKNRLWTGIGKISAGSNLTLTAHDYSSSHLIIIMTGSFAPLPCKFPSLLSLENFSLRFLCTETSQRIPESSMQWYGNGCMALSNRRGFLAHKELPYFKVNAKVDSSM